MCLGVPMKIIKIEEGGKTAIAESFGIRRKISLLLLEDVSDGDWVMVHTGSAIGKLDEENALETIRILRDILKYEDLENR
jgi:hydrogenase expression/formation protein HypC